MLLLGKMENHLLNWCKNIVLSPILFVGGVWIYSSRMVLISTSLLYIWLFYIRRYLTHGSSSTSLLRHLLRLSSWCKFEHWKLSIWNSFQLMKWGQWNLVSKPTWEIWKISKIKYFIAINSNFESITMVCWSSNYKNIW